MRMMLKRREPERTRIGKIRHSMRCGAADAGHRVKDGIDELAPLVKSTMTDAAHTMTDRAQSAASAAQTAAQSAAHTVAVKARPAAQSAAHRVAVKARPAAQSAAQTVAMKARPAAQSAAQTVVAKARPLGTEAMSRGTAALDVLLHGDPSSKKESRLHKIASLGAVSAPAVAAGKVGSTVKKKGNSAVALMAVGGASAMAMLWWRKSRADADAAWITEPEGDMEAGDAWHGGTSQNTYASSASSASAGPSRTAGSSRTGRSHTSSSKVKSGAKTEECEDPASCKDPAHTWP